MWIVCLACNSHETSYFLYKKKKKQEAHGLRVAHLSDIATADMQMLCNIFQSRHRN